MSMLFRPQHCSGPGSAMALGCLDSLERGTVEWNSGMVERWNTGMAINDPVPFLLV